MSSTQALVDRIAGEFGLALARERHDDLLRAVAEIARRHEIAPVDFLALIEREPRALQDLVEAFTIGETHFLRHAPHFEIARACVERRLASAGAIARVWSAGCATGEEPYSVAIAIEGALGEGALARTSILGTDVNRSALERARAGVYSEWSFRGTPGWVVERYFARLDRRLRLASEPVRAAVQFDASNLLARAMALPSGAFDVVFFRNVAIYWDEAALARMYEELARVLRRDGVLLLGPADPHPRARFVAARAPLGDGATVFCVDDGEARPAPPTAEARSATVRRPRTPAPTQPTRAAAPVARPRTPPHPPHPPHPPRLGLAAIVALGDAGAFDDALRAAHALIAEAPTSARGYLVRGQLRLAHEQLDAAVQDLRSAVFLDPDGLVARYWYATALHAIGALAHARNQVRELAARLAQVPASALVDHDAQTPASELLAAVRFLEENLG